MSANSGKVSGFYRGMVLKHLPHGRCKIFIPSVYDDKWITQPDNIPDAELAAPLFGGSNNGNGVFSYPNISSIVWCFFANEDLNYPVYFASTLGGSNAFGQYETILSTRYEKGKNINEMISTEVSSTSHLVTTGKTLVEMFQSGILSIQVSDPIRTDASVDFSNTYQLERQQDHVTSRDICDKILSNSLSNIDCKQVLNVNESNGRALIETNYFNVDNTGKSATNCKTFIDQSNAHNINYGSANLSLDSGDNRESYNNTSFNDDKKTEHILRHVLSSNGEVTTDFSNVLNISNDGIAATVKYFDKQTKSDATSTMKVNATDSTGVFLESENHNSGFKCLININSKDGSIELKVNDLNSDKLSHIYFDRKGIMTLDASELIKIVAPAVEIQALNKDKSNGRFDVKTKYATVKSETAAEVVSNAVKINSTAGKTTIISNNLTTLI